MPVYGLEITAILQKNTVQPLDRWDLKFSLFQVFFKLQLKVINTNVFLQLTFVQNQQQKH